MVDVLLGISGGPVLAGDHRHLGKQEPQMNTYVKIFQDDNMLGQWLQRNINDVMFRQLIIEKMDRVSEFQVVVVYRASWEKF